jgi:hypothetical protein
LATFVWSQTRHFDDREWSSLEKELMTNGFLRLAGGNEAPVHLDRSPGTAENHEMKGLADAGLPRNLVLNQSDIPDVVVDGLTPGKKGRKLFVVDHNVQVKVRPCVTFTPAEGARKPRSNYSLVTFKPIDQPLE